MVRLKTIEKFNLRDFDKLKDIKRVGKDEYGKLFVGDTFECDEEMAKYLTGDNPLKKSVVELVEVIPNKVKEAEFEEVKEEKPKVKKTRSKK